MILAQLINVSKQFGRIQALNGVSLELRQGEILTLLGPNGAGKTTTLNLLLGLRFPDHGQVLLLGQDPRRPEVRRSIGVTPQETAFPWHLTVAETLALVRAHYEQPANATELLERFDLQEHKGRQVGSLSGGQQRRLAVALAFAGNPRLMFLDEPTTGLDVEARHRLWQSIHEYREGGGSVLLTTHYLEEAEILATRVAVIVKGSLIAEGDVPTIKARVGLKRVSFKAETLPELAGVVQAKQENGIITLYTPDADELVRQMVLRGVAFHDLQVFQVSLEEAFLEMIGDKA